MGARPSTLFFLPVKSFMPTLMLRLKDQLAARRQSVRGKRTKLRQFCRKSAAVIPPPPKKRPVLTGLGRLKAITTPRHA